MVFNKILFLFSYVINSALPLQLINPQTLLERVSAKE